MFKKGADGIAKKGKTEGKNLSNFTGAKVMGNSGKSAKHGVSSMAMKDMGRNLARLANQKKAGRGR